MRGANAPTVERNGTTVPENHAQPLETPAVDAAEARASRLHFEFLPGFRNVVVGTTSKPRELFFSGERVGGRGRVQHRAIHSFRLFEMLLVCHGVTLPSVAIRQLVADWTNTAPYVLAGDHVRTSGDSRSTSYLVLAASPSRVLLEVRGRGVWAECKGLHLDVHRQPTARESQRVWGTMGLREPELPPPLSLQSASE